MIRPDKTTGQNNRTKGTGQDRTKPDKGTSSLCKTWKQDRTLTGQRRLSVHPLPLGGVDTGQGGHGQEVAGNKPTGNNTLF